MPNRIIRDGILTSPRVNIIADEPSTEVFYRRLHSVVDDYGRFSAHPSLLRAALYPLRIDRITNAEISRHMEACASVGLLRLYQVDAKPYLEVLDFRQRTRAKASKFPAPEGYVDTNGNGWHEADTCTSSDRHVTDIGRARVGRMTGAGQPCDRHMQAETETETETETESPLWPAFRRCKELHPNCTDPDLAAQIFLSLIDAGKVTEADAAEMEAGMRRWLDSQEWAPGNQPERFSRTYKRFSEWISLLSWRGKPARSETAKAEHRAAQQSSDGADPNAIWIPPWRNKPEAA